MTDKTWKFSQRAAALAVSLVLGTAAQAAIVRGSLDPTATVYIPAYNGFADFQVDDDCLIGDGWKQTGTGSGGCGSVFMQSATIYLYGNTPADPPTGPVQSTLTFGTFSDSEVFGILTQGGQVLGIDSYAMGPAPGDGPYLGRDFWLQFLTGCQIGDSSCSNLFVPDISEFSVLSLEDFPDANPRALLSDDCSEDGHFYCNTDTASYTDRLVFAAIPEPGTMSLLALGALGGGWLARRRKKKAEA